MIGTGADERIDPGRLGFDFDGVIANTAETFLRLACEKYGHCGLRLEQITDFTVENCLDMDAATVEAIFTDILLDSVGTGLQPMAGATEVLGELCETAEVTVITARPEPRPVRDWLARHLPPSTCGRIRLVAMGAHDAKAPHVQARGLTHFIDDRAETCVDLHRQGICSIVFQQPWNRNRHDRPVVRGWDEIRALCL